ncbi:response regulator transcription factor [Hymenobacter taeanensis]|uniref:Response regulator transcription factor n=1 Tax=Hymenobacter taeanensis TaxID=2735321 RepID=A0A6M6BK83_9BACT|nr:MULTISPECIES: LytTR family DNA-binding domain-containing protein [Hymenobacter]QJX48234.1 response regulator transcription factor [Hymenobacter taeanensis]UOQ82285.1 LytTR family DNA-binding domain-containing protein [Hymenobacter sp. 5414T-23]
MTILNCIAVDDEPLALQLVGSFIEKTPFLRLMCSYSSAVAALKGLQQQETPVDVLFLDIQMPDLNGLELARVLDRGPGPGRGPRVVFTTAFNQYALDGYKVDALDYLLKPFTYEEFLRAAHKAQRYAEAEKPAPAVTVPAVPAEDYLYLKVEYQLVRVPYADILYIEGLKDYIKVYRRSEPRPLLSLQSLKALEERLPKQFMRIHRSYIVALNHITTVGRGTVQIANETIPISEGYRESFDQYIRRWK